MTEQDTLHRKVCDEMARFQRTMQEIRMLKTVSQDLKSYRRMMKLKKYD
ncbi:MAG: hypothetical protein ACE14S_01855 [Candidatus Bathyarchaeia archaeon]